MKIVIRCVENHMYNFVFATAVMDARTQTLEIEDRDGGRHWFPLYNVIHVSSNPDTEDRGHG